MEKKRLIVMIIIIILFIIAIAFSFLYYNDKYKISFETGTEESIITQYVSKNSKVSKPNTPEKEGYVFVEWQLNGETYNFDREVKEDVVLSAKWVKEEYITIKYETYTDEVIEPNKILKGSKIDKLPKVNKEGYEFIGWYLNDNLYNDEEINSDTILTAQYKNDNINTTYKIGDKVLIIGSYAKNAMSTNYKNTMAIGWEREILNIINDAENPYVIGDKSGVTGYFKANSIEVVENS